MKTGLRSTGDGPSWASGARSSQQLPRDEVRRAQDPDHHENGPREAQFPGAPTRRDKTERLNDRDSLKLEKTSDRALVEARRIFAHLECDPGELAACDSDLNAFLKEDKN